MSLFLRKPYTLSYPLSIDNGINQTAEQPKYAVRSDLGSRVKRLNPNWNESTTDEIYDVRPRYLICGVALSSYYPHRVQLTSQAKFAQASQLTGEEFLEQLNYFAKAWLPARDVVKASLDKRLEVDPSGAIVVFNQVSHLTLHPITCPYPSFPIYQR